MKRIILLLCVLTLVGIPASCARASDKTQEQTKQNEIEVSFEDTKESSDAISLDKKETMEQKGYTIAVPSSYKTVRQKNTPQEALRCIHRNALQV
jgi:hypothetical protein